MRRLLAFTAMILAFAPGAEGVAYAQPAPEPLVAAEKPLAAAEREQAVTELARTLEASFVFPEVGARYAVMLRANLAKGAYDGLSDPEDFGKRVTADLQAVSPDGHLRLAPRAVFAAARPARGDAPQSALPNGPPGLEEARMIGDVAYLRFNEFPNGPLTAHQALSFLLAHADAKAVIIDARPHRGGGLAVMDAILPLFYAQQTDLLRMDTRAGVTGPGAAPDGPTLVRQVSPPSIVRQDHVVTPDPGERRLQNTPVYYLTSRRTASAAEHLALAFKRTHRATLIGETTYGAGHYGALLPIGARFAAFVPVGRTYDPDTGWDWEGKGVAPDVATGADEALDEALRRAKQAGAHPA
ncbi:S41 family peptidase [Phenylobacterium sp.]|uniref:S41 family peptidase n=1 Tax=Phenylobacterium sp. TaxID=1871053 RepID=UPI002BCFD3C3|nr:S41 family peptidase [Phenylobacterium sp.]HLZ74702.1 S41 family peptidase [Phenylobacterium sp.]